MIPLRTEWRALTDTGAVRRHNEDRYLASDALGLWAVADGMGGMARGDWAADVVVEALAAAPRAESLAAMVSAARLALDRANELILAESELRGERMGSTAVVAIIRERELALIWLGDSRAYLVRDGVLRRLTRDHSQVMDLVERGVITETEAAAHPLRNVLTRAVGVARPLEPGALTSALEADDLLLLCSDGLHGVVGEAEMRAAFDREPVESAAATLIRRCHELGAPDNITLVAVAVHEPTLVRFEPIATGFRS